MSVGSKRVRYNENEQPELFRAIEEIFGVIFFEKRTKIKDRGCAVSLSNICKKRLTLNVEKYCTSKGIETKRCDFAIFLEGKGKSIMCISIECKMGELKPKVVCQQLEATAVLIRRKLSSFNINIIAVAITGGSIKNKISVRRSGSSKETKLAIQVSGMKIDVKRGRCGGRNNLYNAIRDDL